MQASARQDGVVNLEQRVAIAVDRVRYHYEALPPTLFGRLPIWIAFSGGKDSQAIAEIARMTGLPFTLNYSVTGLDPPELVRFIRENYPEAIWHRPRKTMRRLMIEHRCPPLRHQRWCCEELKESHGQGLIMTGVRWAESARRKAKAVTFRYCPDRNAYILNPIIDWEDKDVWDFLNWRGLPHCSLYDEGFHRLGCVLCPMHGRDARVREIARWPRMANNWYRWLSDLNDYRAAHGLRMDWVHPAQTFEWWIYEEGGTEAAKDQRCLMFG